MAVARAMTCQGGATRGTRRRPGQSTCQLLQQLLQKPQLQVVVVVAVVGVSSLVWPGAEGPPATVQMLTAVTAAVAVAAAAVTTSQSGNLQVEGRGPGSRPQSGKGEQLCLLCTAAALANIQLGQVTL